MEFSSSDPRTSAMRVLLTMSTARYQQTNRIAAILLLLIKLSKGEEADCTCYNRLAYAYFICERNEAQRLSRRDA